MANGVERIRVAGLDVTVDPRAVRDLFDRAPHKTFFHLRDVYGSIFGSHRREWLARTEVKFNRGGMRAAPFGRSETGRGFQTDKQFYYTVDPKRKSVPKSETPNLEEIQGEAYTRSEVALGLETGGTFRAIGNPLMAIPIGFALNKLGRPKAGFSSPEALKKHPRLVFKDLVAFKMGNRKSPVLYLVKALKTKTILLPVFVLVRSITRKPRMRFMATWDALVGDRDQRLSRALTRIVEELEHGK